MGDKSVNELRERDGTRYVRSVCPNCGRFLAETPLSDDVRTRTNHYCPSCKNLIPISITYTHRCY